MPKKYARSSYKKTNKKNKLGILALSVIVILLILAQVINFGKMLFKPYTSFGTSKNYSLNDDFNINLVVKGKTIAVFSLNPLEKEVTIVNFPDNTLADVPSGFGQWQIRSVLPLGQSSDHGWQLLDQTISSLLGVPIDGFLEFNNDISQVDLSELIQKYNKSYFSGLSDIKNIQTSLTLIELLRLKIALTQVRFDKIKYIDLAQEDVLDKGKLNDGTEIFTADQVKIDSTITGLADPVIKNERQTIAVFNATNHPQLAQKAARLITNLGGNVIITATSEKTYPKTQVIGTNSKTLVRLKQIFDLGCAKDPKCDKICPDSQTTKMCIQDLDIENSRAQINIVLGEDFYNRQ